MKIETKFNINDLVFYFSFFINEEENKVEAAIVSDRISMILVKEEGIRYLLGADNRELRGDELFTTREQAEQKLKKIGGKL